MECKADRTSFLSRPISYVDDFTKAFESLSIRTKNTKTKQRVELVMISSNYIRIFLQMNARADDLDSAGVQHDSDAVADPLRL